MPGGGRQAQGLSHGFAVVEAFVVKIVEQDGNAGTFVQVQAVAEAKQPVVVLDHHPRPHGGWESGVHGREPT